MSRAGERPAGAGGERWATTLETAKTIGLTIPQAILVRADDVVQ